jgi:hypothetical protein
MQSHLHRGQWKLKHACDLVGRKSVGIMQQQNRLVCVGQFRNIPLNALAHLRLLNDRQRRWPSPVRNGQLFHRSLYLARYRARPLPQAIDAHVRRNLVEPAFQRRRIAQRLSFVMCPKQSLLGKVLCLTCIADQVANVSSHTGSILFCFIAGRRRGRYRHSSHLSGEVYTCCLAPFSDPALKIPEHNVPERHYAPRASSSSLIPSRKRMGVPW